MKEGEIWEFRSFSFSSCKEALSLCKDMTQCIMFRTSLQHLHTHTPFWGGGEGLKRKYDKSTYVCFSHICYILVILISLTHPHSERNTELKPVHLNHFYQLQCFFTNKPRNEQKRKYMVFFVYFFDKYTFQSYA